MCSLKGSCKTLRVYYRGRCNGVYINTYVYIHTYTCTFSTGALNIRKGLGVHFNTSVVGSPSGIFTSGSSFCDNGLPELQRCRC